TVAPYLGLAVLPIVWTGLNRYPSARLALPRLAGLGLPLMVVPLPWLARNLLVEGNPNVENCPGLFALGLTTTSLLRRAAEPLAAQPVAAALGLSLLAAGLIVTRRFPPSGQGPA